MGLMKVQLIVVQGKPEGKMIPLVGPKFKIGRGETCNLRPNSEEVSREHAEFSMSADNVVVSDLGSRNGTLVNGKRLAAKEPCPLKDSDLIQIGPLTFAISIQGVTAPVVAKGQPKAAAKPASPDDISHADIESWLVSDAAGTPPDRPSGIYGGDTQTMKAYKAGPASKTKAADEVSDQAEEAVDDESETRDEVETISDQDETPPEEMVDESNPFYVAKKKTETQAKKPAKDSSDAASDILRRLMERRRPH
jgi:predicted component of type VI protein secretion system